MGIGSRYNIPVQFGDIVRVPDMYMDGVIVSDLNNMVIIRELVTNKEYLFNKSKQALILLKRDEEKCREEIRPPDSVMTFNDILPYEGNVL